MVKYQVGITQRVCPQQEYNSERFCLDREWASFMNKVETFTLIPLIPIEKNIECYWNSLNLKAIIFSGGNDLSFMNPTPQNILRDQYEKKLLKWSLKNSLPIVGICRGMQFIANFFGATIYLNSENTHVNSKHNLTWHHTEIKTNKFKKFIDQSSYTAPIVVNSYHNYFVDIDEKKFSY